MMVTGMEQGQRAMLAHLGWWGCSLGLLGSSLHNDNSAQSNGSLPNQHLVGGLTALSWPA